MDTAVAWKHRLMEMGWEEAAFQGARGAERLYTTTTTTATRGSWLGPSSLKLAQALQALWAEVRACQAPGASIDYEACLAALEP